jgi:hypothetical protein
MGKYSAVNGKSSLFFHNSNCLFYIKNAIFESIQRKPVSRSIYESKGSQKENEIRINSNN